MFSGILYDEAGGAGGRGIMAMRGEKVTWTSDGKKEVTGRLGKSEEIQAKIKKDDWNEYVVIARGNRLQHFINGVPTVDVFDDAEGKRLDSGILALAAPRRPADDRPVQGHPHQVAELGRRERRRQRAGGQGIQARPALLGAEGDPGLLGGALHRPEGPPDRRRPERQALPHDARRPRAAAGRSSPRRSAWTSPAPTACSTPSTASTSMVNERGTHGLYRVRDTDGDDRYDEVKLLREIKGGGEHGMHSIVLSPDGKSLYVVCGNSTELTKVDSSRVPLNWGEDNLATRIPTGFMDDSLAPQGWIARTDPDGKEWELIAAGLRNPFDIAFDRDGELFTYDADMEWDIGEPWYRPTRVNHVISGGEYGFRNGSGKWPAYSIDSFGAVVDIGPGSPTGITFGYGAKFPEKYRNALFISDWSFGKLRAVHLQARGGQLHRRGRGVPQRPAAAGDGRGHQPEGRGDVPRRGRPRGAVGPVPRDLRRRRGRRLAEPARPAGPGAAGTCAGSWRPITGTATPAPSRPPGPTSATRTGRSATPPGSRWSGRTRRSGRRRPWASPTRARRSPPWWRWRASAAGTSPIASRPTRGPTRPCGAGSWPPWTASTGRAWARPTASTCCAPTGWRSHDWAGPTTRRAGGWPRSSTPCSPRGSSRSTSCWPRSWPTSRRLRPRRRSWRPSGRPRRRRSRSSTRSILRVLKAGWTLPLREEYFRWFVTTAAAYRGGNTFASSLRTIKTQAIETLTADERAALKPVLEAQPAQNSMRELLAARKPVKEWTVAELVPVVERGLDGPPRPGAGPPALRRGGLRRLPPLRHARAGASART